MIPLFVAIPLATAFLISLLGKYYKSISDILANLSSLLLVVLSFMTLNILRSSDYTPIVYKVGGWVPPIGICMVVDGLTVIMLIVVNIVALMAVIFSISYMEKYTEKWKYYTLFMLMMAGMNGVIITGDMFNMYVFLEIGAISSYALVAFGTEHEELEASFKYMVLGSVASLFILLGIAILYSHTSSLNMADISQILFERGNPTIVNFVTVLFLIGFGVKSAIVPFHAWLPDAHPSAPAPISAMLSGVLIKSLGVYALVRIMFNVLGADIGNVLIILGIISMVVGGLLAIYQKDFKRLLAYSTVSQVGYIIFAFGLWTPLGILAGLFHLVNHAFAKSLLFLNSGAVVYATDGERNLEKLGGLKERMPVTATTSLIGSMSIAGVPPFGGFWSKLLIILAGIQAKQVTGTFIAVLVSIVTLGYYLKLQKQAFFGKLPEQWQNIKEVPLTMKIPVLVLAVLCIFMGIILIPQVKTILLDPAVEVLENGIVYGKIIFENVK